MAYSLADHVRLARAAWESGHSILLHVANGILKDNGIDLVVEQPRDKCPEGIVGSLNYFGRELLKQLRPLEPYIPEGLLIDDQLPWIVGAIHPLGFMADGTFAESIALEFSYDGENEWEEKFVAPMRRHATLWRAQFDDLMERVDSLETMPDDPITLAEMDKLGSIPDKTRRNWGIADRPVPVIQARGNRAAVFSYKTIRDWFILKQPDRSHFWPANYSEARQILSKMSN